MPLRTPAAALIPKNKSGFATCYHVKLLLIFRKYRKRYFLHNKKSHTPQQLWHLQTGTSIRSIYWNDSSAWPVMISYNRRNNDMIVFRSPVHFAVSPLYNATPVPADPDSFLKTSSLRFLSTVFSISWAYWIFYIFAQFRRMSWIWRLPRKMTKSDRLCRFECLRLSKRAFSCLLF